jgi:hypothetical protein
MPKSVPEKSPWWTIGPIRIGCRNCASSPAITRISPLPSDRGDRPFGHWRYCGLMGQGRCLAAFYHCDDPARRALAVGHQHVSARWHLAPGLQYLLALGLWNAGGTGIRPSKDCGLDPVVRNWLRVAGIRFFGWRCRSVRCWYGLFGLLWILSQRDERFHDVIDRRTIELFVLWFFFCIIATLTNIMRVANIAHGAGAVLGILTGFAITLPRRRVLFASGVAVFLLFGLWAAIVGRPMINLSGKGGYQESRWGFDALIANRN